MLVRIHIPKDTLSHIQTHTHFQLHIHPNVNTICENIYKHRRTVEMWFAKSKSYTCFSARQAAVKPVQLSWVRPKSILVRVRLLKFKLWPHKTKQTDLHGRSHSEPQAHLFELRCIRREHWFRCWCSMRYSGSSIGLDCEGRVVASLALHLGLDGAEVRVAHLHVPRPDVPRVPEVGGLPDHGPVDPPPLLLLLDSFPPVGGLIEAAREPLHPHVPRHVGGLEAWHPGPVKSACQKTTTDDRIFC